MTRALHRGHGVPAPRGWMARAAFVSLAAVAPLAGCDSDAHPPGDASVGHAGGAAGAAASGAGVDAAAPDRVQPFAGAAAADAAALDAAGTSPVRGARDAGLDASRIPGQPVFVDASVAVPCQDDDGDGFGVGCSRGDDCDDTDPAVTDACYRCAEPNDGCPCERGTRPIFCMPDSIHVDGGVLVCSEGSRYCRDGTWSACEAIGEFTFVPSG